MKTITSITAIILLLLTVSIEAQTENEFLNRGFWKENPSINEVEEKIAAGNSISEFNSNLFDATTFAILAKTDNTTIKHLLSKKGNGVNKLTHDARTYIFWAAYSNNVELMQYLLKQGANTKIVDSHGNSVLNFAATTGQTNLKIYDLLISNGTDVAEEKNPHGANALLLSAPHATNFELIDFLVSKGVSLESEDAEGNGIFNYTAKGGNIDVLKSLVKRGVNYKGLNHLKGNAILAASSTRRGVKPSIETFSYLEGLGIEPNITNNKGLTPLHAIAYNTKNLEIYDYFISKGVAINQADSDGNTVFLNAASRNDLATITYLFKQIKDVNHTNTDGKSALTFAVQRNTPEVIKFLLGNNANATIKDSKGNNLAYYLAPIYSPKKSGEFNKKLALLSKKGFDFAQPQEDGNTLYHLAAAKNDMNLMLLIKDLKLDVNAINKEGNSALHIAAMKSKNASILKYLLSQGADKNAKTEFEESVLDLASENELLIKNNVELNFLK